MSVADGFLRWVKRKGETYWHLSFHDHSTLCHDNGEVADEQQRLGDFLPARRCRDCARLISEQLGL